MPAEIMPLRPPGAIALPDVGEWQNRFEIRSEISNRVYVISRNKKTMKWGCSCPGWITHRKCKHLLDGCRLPLSEIHQADRIAADRKRLKG